MNLRIDNKEKTVELELPIRGGNVQMVTIPKRNIHYWYPFNTNFFYRYSEPKEMMYLSKDARYKGENIYNIDILKRTKPLQQVGNIPFHPYVYKRNKYIILKANKLGIPTIDKKYDIVDIESGFEKVGNMIDELSKKTIERVEQDYQEKEEKTIPQWEFIIENYTSEEDKKEYEMLGEIYTMLVLMKKNIKSK